MSYICSKIFEKKKKKFKSGSEIPPEFFFFFRFQFTRQPFFITLHFDYISYFRFGRGGGGGASVRVLVDSLLNT